MSLLGEPNAYLGELLAYVQQTTSAALPMLERWGILIIVLMVFSEFVVGLGYFAQADATLIAAGVLYGDSVWMVAASLLVATGAAALGSLLSRRLGTAGRRISDGRPKRPSLSRVAAAVRRHAGLLAFVFHFSAWLRPSVPVVAGASGVAEREWFPWDVAGAATWAGLLLVLGVRLRGMLYRNVRVADVFVLLILMSAFGGVALIARKMVGRGAGGSAE